MNEKKKKKDKERSKKIRTMTFWVILFLSILVIFNLIVGRKKHGQEISYSEFKEQLKSGNIASVTVDKKEIKGELKTESSLFIPAMEKTITFKNFKTYIPFEDQDLADELVEKGIEVNAKPAFSLWGTIGPYIPLILLLLFWFILLGRMQTGPTKAFTFGRSKAKVVSEDKPKVTFKDVAGIEEAKQELYEVIGFLKNPLKFRRLGARIPKGVLLLGAPGTGKTLLAKAVAGEAQVPFFSISGSDFVEMFVGVGASRVRDLFEQGKKSAPCIIFIDEIDAVGRLRGAGIGGGHDEREQTLNQLLVSMDGFDTQDGVIILAATNRPDILDPALLRPGRFDRQVIIDRPDLKGREGIFKVHTKKKPLAEDVDLKVLARGTPGFSGADIANVVNEAVILAARHNRKKVTRIDFDEARDKILMGMERKSMIISSSEKRNAAYHEAGHVLVSKMIEGMDPIHKVTIIPRGRALGVTQQLPIDERHNLSRTYCMNQLAFTLGGRAAEKIVLHDVTTGSGNDIEQVTGIARKMVCEWGMSDSLGPLTFGKKEEEVFLGREIATHRDYSEETAKLIDKEVRKIVEEAQKRAEDIILKNLPKLHAIANALLEKELLDGDEVDEIIKGVADGQKKDKKGSS